ncbi:hypothetical protein CDL12_14856 [Handroanthus impetiginosus]|uniref:F-box domain-containing protein n=1 Tax=Handroanthus impetiginosus TaxID=429701 RepID=A0A2G9H4S8_9LAMI|nr:hypothetical protein CDL12_14856 [Handroanthus impetiginosus]
MEVVRTHKRKLSEIDEDGSTRFQLNELNQDLLERVLSWLPTSSFFRLSSVCKKWRSVANSATFKRACSRVPSRDPWFFMVESQPNLAKPIIFDSTEGNWKKINHPPMFPPADFIPVASSSGLICFRSADGGFFLTNPVTGSCRQLPPPFADSQPPVRAIGMISNAQTLKLVTYFLSKCGNVVSTDIQRSPPKQYSSLLTIKNGEEILYFLSSSGTVVTCNLTRKFFFEYPRLLPVFSEYSIDLVECGGEIYVVLLSEFLESAGLRVWTWDDSIQSWRQIAAMPPAMSHKFYGKKVDINCSGAGQRMFVCVNSAEVCSYVMCDLGANEWVELPECCNDGEVKEFVCAFSFEPRIEASAW